MKPTFTNLMTSGLSHLLMIGFVLALIAVVPAAADPVPISLAQFPGIHPEVLRLNGELFEVAEPVSYDPVSGLALFYVSVGEDQEAIAGEYAFAGDAYSLLCFARELEWLSERDPHPIEVGGEFVESIAERLVNVFTDLLSLIWFILNNPSEFGEQAKEGYAAAKEFAREYHDLWKEGKVDPLEDSLELVKALATNHAIGIASRHNLDYFELQTDAAVTAMWDLGVADMVGGLGGDIITVFVPFAAAKHALAASKGVATIAKITAELEARAPFGDGLRILAKYGSVIPSSAAPAARVTRMRTFAAAETRVDHAVILRSLLSPAKRTMKDPRGMNRRMNQLMYWINNAEARGMQPSVVLREAIADLPAHGTQAGTGKMFDTVGEVDNLLVQYARAQKFGVFDDVSNLGRMRRGRAPVLNIGSADEVIMEWDHILPVKNMPELSHSPINLEIETRARNRSKGAGFSQKSRDKLEELRDRGMYTQERYDELLATVDEGIARN